MLKRNLLLAAVAGCLLLPLGARGTTDVPTTLGITATVDAFAEWDPSNPAAIAANEWAGGNGLPGHIGRNTDVLTKTVTLKLITNSTVTITPSDGAGHGGTLMNGTQELLTTYQMTGAALAATADGSPKNGGTNPGEFCDGTTYTIAHSSGTGLYQFDLTVTATTKTAGTAPDVGDYVCTLTLTASF